MHFYTHLLLLLQPSGAGFLLLTLIMMQSHRQSELMNHESDPGQAGYPTLKRFIHLKI